MGHTNFYILERKLGANTVDYVAVRLNDRGGVSGIGLGLTEAGALENVLEVLPGEFVGGRLASTFGYGATPYFNEVAQRFQEMADAWAEALR